MALSGTAQSALRPAAPAALAPAAPLTVQPAEQLAVQQEPRQSSIEPDFGYFQLEDGRRVIEDPDNPGRWTAVIQEVDSVVSAAAAAAIAAAHEQLRRLESAAAAAAGGPSANRLEGVVADWTGSPGYGFVHFSDGRRAYVHSSQCAGQALLKGQAVSAEIVEDPKNPGKWQAVSVERLHTLSTNNAARLEGIVAEWTGSPGYGFIHFSDGRRAYVHNSQCGGSALAKGQAVSGLIAEDPKNPGKWQAQSVVAAGAGAAISGSVGVPGLPGLASNGTLLGSLAPGGPAGLPAQERHQGTVTQWSEKGFGFIQFTDGRFAYVHNSSCGGQHLAPGETVTAILVEDAKNPGKLAAQEVQRQSFSEDGTVVEWDNNQGTGSLQMDDGRRAIISRAVLGGAENLRCGARLRVRTSQDALTPGKWCVAEFLGSLGQDGLAHDAMVASQEPVVVGERCTGTVVEWDGKGVGSLLMEDGRQAEVYDSSPLEPGQVVSAVVAPDPNIPGKFLASGLEMGPYTGDEGTVTEWHEGHGYGFIQLDDLRKLYIHRSAFGGVGALTVGTRIRVTAKPDLRNPGKWMAGQVMSSDGTALGSTGSRPARPGGRGATVVAPPTAGAPVASPRLPGIGIGGSGITPVSAGRGDLGGIGGSGINPVSSSTSRSPPAHGGDYGGANQTLTELMAIAAAELAGDAAKRARTTPPAAQFPML